MESLERPDGSGSSMADKIARFGGSLLEMVDAERLEVLESLTTVTTGDIHDRSFDPGEVRSASDPYLPNVRLANGSVPPARRRTLRSEEHTSELQYLMRISYAVFCLK